MIRVLHVIGGMNRAGAETMLMNIYRKIDLKKIQFDFLIYSDKKQDYEDEIYQLGGRIIRCPLEKKLGLIKSIGEIRKIIDSYGPYKAIHIHTLHNSVFPLLAMHRIDNVLKITHSHSSRNSTKSNFIRRVYEEVSKKIIRILSDKYYACSENAGVYLFGKKFLQEGRIINNCIDIDEFTNVYYEEVRNLKKQFRIQNELIIGHVGRLSDVKNHKFMIEIAKKLIEDEISFKLFFVGSGELDAELKQIVVENNLTNNVFFLGTRNDIPVLLRFFDVFLMPSIFEGLPVTLIEAQVSSLPCIISDTITNSVDLNLGLIKLISLKKGVKEWAEQLVNFNRKNFLCSIDVKNQIKVKEYDSNVIAEILTCEYLGVNE